MKKLIVDGNGGAAYVSYALSEIAVIYPITPASPMAELADIWAKTGKTNLFGKIPQIVQMQSEAGAAGALHGALSCGALATTYTCSQGLLLMLPELYKMAGELLPTVLHVSSRSLATHALSIFGDHQDVMACRQTGAILLCSASVQESFDFALLAHLAAWKCSLPILHFFDGFRTSHETTDISVLTEEEMRELLPQAEIARFRGRALDPNRPVQRGTAQNPDIYSQNREAANPYFLAVPSILQGLMEDYAEKTGRAYHLFDYFGDSEAERVLVVMGSGGVTARETVNALNAHGERVGVIQVRLYRPFDGDAFYSALPKSCKRVIVLDRTKEGGALGEPLYLDVCAVLQAKGATHVCVYGGRYGLGGKEFTPATCKAVFDNAKASTPKNHFTVGILDDVTFSSLPVDTTFSLPQKGSACIFYGLGSDGTVGANKSSMQILGKHTHLHVQGYFCYDSRKSGGVTVSHLRFGEAPIHAPYLIDQADFIACHNPSYLERYDMLSTLKEGGVVLLNCPHAELSALEEFLPVPFKRQLAAKNARLYVLDGRGIAEEVGLGGKISTVMQAAFFYLNPLLPYPQAKGALLEEIERKYKAKGDSMVALNALCIEKMEGNLREINYPKDWATTTQGAPMLSRPDDPYFQRFMLPILSLRGDELPVSAFQADGSVPTDTIKWEKHGAPPFTPKWILENCIQCNQCAFVCPHACIRPFLFAEERTPDLPTLPATGIKEARFRIQVSPHDCMGCGVCARTCPTKEKALVMGAIDLQKEGAAWELCSSTKQIPSPLPRNNVKGSQFYPPLFEFSYACSGCGETPYIKLLTQLFGERLIIANATGCSSIYGGSAPSCPYTVNGEGKGPAWANSLFEDNAEFGYGMRLALNARKNADASVWLIGGDGWAYDIGFGGLDHVLSKKERVRILVLDSEVYSNTGGQTSKATPLGAVARFASQGKRTPKKQLGLMAMTYQNAYIAQVSMGANKQQLIHALTEAEAHDGPALIIAYSPCIAHGVYMGKCMEEEKLAVESGYWLLYRYNPAKRGEGALLLDSKPASEPLRKFLEGENRFAQLLRESPEEAEALFAQAEKDCQARYELFSSLSKIL